MEWNDWEVKGSGEGCGGIGGGRVRVGGVGGAGEVNGKWLEKK